MTARITMTTTVAAEIAKLRRSLVWIVVIGLPVIMVAAGSFTAVASAQPPADGWHTVWLRSVVFYGLVPLSVGLGILGSAVWRPEHTGGNWNALMGSPVPSLQIVTAKALTVTLLGAAMQLVLVLAVTVAAKVVFGLPGWLPGRYLLVTGLLMLTVFPVAALQSGLSMLLRSFAAPIAVALVGGAIAVLVSIARIPVAVYLLPYGLLSRSARLGTGTFGDSGTLDAGPVALLVVLSAALTAVALHCTAAVLDRRDITA